MASPKTFAQPKNYLQFNYVYLLTTHYTEETVSTQIFVNLPVKKLKRSIELLVVLWLSTRQKLAKAQ